jgi:hypothetical protein
METVTLLMVDALVRNLPARRYPTDTEFVAGILRELRRTTCRHIPEEVLLEFGELLRVRLPRCPHCRRVYPTWVNVKMHCKNCPKAPRPRWRANRRHRRSGYTADVRAMSPH